MTQIHALKAFVAKKPKWYDKILYWLDDVHYRWFILNKYGYWINSHFFNRHHIMNLKGFGDYKYGWIDQCHRMELAVWKCFIDFVELEKPFEKVIFEKKIAREIKTCHTWWKTGKHIQKANLDKILGTWHDDFPFKDQFVKSKDGTYSTLREDMYKDPRWKKYKKASDAYEKKEQEMLAKVFALKDYLWT